MRVLCIVGDDSSGRMDFIVAFSKQLAQKESTVVVDAVTGKRDIPVAFGVQDEVVYDWYDYLLGSCDAEKCKIFVDDKLSVVASSYFSDKAEPTTEQIQRLIGELNCEYVLFDAGTEEIAKDIFSVSTDVVVLTQTGVLPDTEGVRRFAVLGRHPEKSARDLLGEKMTEGWLYLGNMQEIDATESSSDAVESMIQALIVGNGREISPPSLWSKIVKNLFGGRIHDS